MPRRSASRLGARLLSRVGAGALLAALLLLALSDPPGAASPTEAAAEDSESPASEAESGEGTDEQRLRLAQFLRRR